ncbi:MAG: hypothetical protein RIF33_14590 [Cyclobacteriaceae bacterium]
MSIFEHVSVFLCIILGLAVVHLIGGLAMILDAHTKARLYWIHIAWTVCMLFIVILVWLGSFVLSPLSQIGALHFLNLLAYAMVTSLMSGLLFPVGGGKVEDYRQHFEANKVRLYYLGIIFVIVDGVDGVLEHYNAGIEWDIGQYGTLAIWFLALLSGLIKKNSKIDTVIVVLMLIGIIGWFMSLIDTSVLIW